MELQNVSKEIKAKVDEKDDDMSKNKINDSAMDAKEKETEKDMKERPDNNKVRLLRNGGDGMGTSRPPTRSWGAGKRGFCL